MFEPYKLKSPTEVCWHCHSPEEERVVHQAPLRRLSPDALSGFAADSLMTWGDLGDVKHFLPRTFEILAFDRFPRDDPDMETVVGVLGRGDWNEWPVHERDAVRAFLRALWADQLHAWPSGSDIDTVLSSIAMAEDDLTAYLDEWESSAGQAPVLHFAEFLIANVMRVARGKRLSNPWLEARVAQEAQVRAWLIAAQERFVERIEAAFLAAPDESSMALLSTALDVLPARS